MHAWSVLPLKALSLTLNFAMLRQRLSASFLFWAGLALLFGLRLLFSLSLESHPDESYYALYARHLSWGYVDHGPVVAWFIKFFTFFNESPFTIRSGSILTLSALSLHLYFFGKKYFSLRFALFLSCLFSFSMIFHSASVVMTPDAPLTLFSIWAIMAYFLAFYRQKNTFLLGGFCLGFALLSKISAAFLGLALFLSPFLLPKLADFRKHTQFYLSFVIAGMVFLPFIFWNQLNDWAFFRYQGAHIQEAVAFGESVGLWITAILVSGPLFTRLLFYEGFKTLWRKRSEPTAFFGLLCVVPFIYFFLSSFKNNMELNWLLPVFFSLPFLGAIILEQAWPRFQKLFYVQLIWSLFLIFFVSLHMIIGFLPLPLKKDGLRKDYFQYQGLLQGLQNHFYDDHRLQAVRLVANNYQIPSLINQYLKPQKEALCLSINYHPTLYSFLYPNRLQETYQQLYIHKGLNPPTFLAKSYSVRGPIYHFKTVIRAETIADFTLWEIVKK